MSARIVIKRKKNLVDVFFGEQGWAANNWCRLAVVPTRNGTHIKFLTGAMPSKEDYVAVCKSLGA